MHVTTHKNFTPNINITAVMLQGDPLSPLLFHLFSTDLLQFFCSKNATFVCLDIDNKLFMLAYADYIFIFANSIKDINEKLSNSRVT